MAASRFRHRVNGLAVISLIAMMSGGCSQSASEGKLSGRVLLDGKPLLGGIVTFCPTDPSLKSVAAAIDESGNYGPVAVPAGEVLISVDNRKFAPRQHGVTALPDDLAVESRQKMLAQRAKAPAPSVSSNPRYTPIPSRYYSIDFSKLSFKMESGDQTHDIELTARP